MDVELPNGAIIRGIPDGTPKNEIMAKAAKAGLIEPSIAHKFMQGLTLGFGDELAGIDAAAIEFAKTRSLGKAKDAYGKARGTFNQRLKDTDSAYPVWSIVAELAGGVVVPGVGVGKAAFGKDAQAAQKYARYALSGAVPGAVAGAGYADSGERLKGAYVGGAVGGAVGAAAPAVLNTMKGVLHTFQAIFGKSPSYAERKMIEAMARDGLSSDQIIAKMQKNQNLLPVDVGGENVKGLARASASFPGYGKNQAERTLTSRAFGSGDRVKRSLERNLSDVDDVYGQLDVVNANARKAAKPLYDAAYKQNIPITDELSDLLKKPSMAKAWGEAKKIAAEEGHDLPEVFKIENGKVVDVIEAPDMKTFDYMKRGLDDVVEGYKDEFGRVRTAAGNAVNTTRKTLNELLEAQNPTWKKAKQVWQGKIQLEQALLSGQKFLNDDFDLSKRAISKMNDAEKEMFRVGVRKALRTKINKMGDQFDVGKRVFGNKDIRAKLKMAFPDEKSFRTFQSDVMAEMKMSDTKAKILGNSATARIQGEQADLMIDPTAVAQAARGDISGAALAGLRYIQNKSKVPSEAMGRNLTNILYNREFGINVDPEAQRLMQQWGAGLLGGSNIGLQGLMSGE